MKYKTLKPFEARNWEVGDIVFMDDRSAKSLLESGAVEVYTGDEPHKHMAITVDPVKLSNKVNEIL